MRRPVPLRVYGRIVGKAIELPSGSRGFFFDFDSGVPYGGDALPLISAWLTGAAAWVSKSKVTP